MGGVNASRARRLTASGVSEAGPRNAEASAADKTSGGSRPRGTSYSSRPGTQVPAVIEGRRGRANRKKERNQKQRENEAQREREIRPPRALVARFARGHEPPAHRPRVQKGNPHASSSKRS